MAFLDGAHVTTLSSDETMSAGQLSDRAKRSGNEAFTRRLELLLGVIVVLTLASGVLFAIRDGEGTSRWLAVGLLALFAASFAVQRRAAQSPRASVAIVAAQIALTTVGAVLIPLLNLVLMANVLRAGKFLPRRWTMWAAGGAAAINVAIQTWRGGFPIGLQDGLLNGVLLLLVGSLAASLRYVNDLRRESNSQVVELEEAQRQLHHHADQERDLAIAGERTRVARELHDNLGHRLTIAAVQLEAAQSIIHTDTARAQSMTGAAHAQIVEGLADVRETVNLLRDARRPQPPLADAILAVCSDFEGATGMRVVTDVSRELHALADPQWTVLLRGCQEALTNIQRHARAAEILVTLQPYDSGVVLTVEDDGVGIDADALGQGYGLQGMQERVIALGGRTSAVPRTDSGTIVRLWLPSGSGGTK